MYTHIYIYIYIYIHVYMYTCIHIYICRPPRAAWLPGSPAAWLPFVSNNHLNNLHFRISLEATLEIHKQLNDH